MAVLLCYMKQDALYYKLIALHQTDESYFVHTYFNTMLTIINNIRTNNNKVNPSNTTRILY
jgi:hypothetical protein